MPKNRFYCPDKLALGAVVKLPEPAAIHAVRALRMSEGDKAILFNGDGFDYACELIAVKKNNVTAKVHGSVEVTNEPPLNITLLQGISSGDRMDYTIQKAVELGVKHIQPIATQRSIVKLNQERMLKRVKHWQNVATSACEQSGRAYVPAVATPLPLNDWLANNPNNQSCRILLNPIGAKRLAEIDKPAGKPTYKTTDQSKHEIELLIGAEGGLSPDEIEAASTNGFLSIVLGPRILRTETAALTAISSMHTLWGDF